MEEDFGMGGTVEALEETWERCLGGMVGLVIGCLDGGFE